MAAPAQATVNAIDALGDQVEGARMSGNGVYLSRCIALWVSETITPDAHARPCFVFLDACMTGKETFVFRFSRNRDAVRAGLDALACRKTDKRAYRRHQTRAVV